MTARIKGRAGTTVGLTVLSRGRKRSARVARERVDLPIVQSRLERADGKKIAYVSLASFTSGAHGELGAAVRRRLKQGADGVCSTCATTAAGS